MSYWTGVDEDARLEDDDEPEHTDEHQEADDREGDYDYRAGRFRDVD